MSLSEFEVAQCRAELDAFLLRRRPPLDLRKDVDLCGRITDSGVDIYEMRRPYRGREKTMEVPIARVKWVKSRLIWRLFWMRADQKWHSYSPMPDAKKLVELFDEIERDLHACFFG
jgi:hypothetical protein